MVGRRAARRRGPAPRRWAGSPPPLVVVAARNTEVPSGAAIAARSASRPAARAGPGRAAPPHAPPDRGRSALLTREALIADAVPAGGRARFRITRQRPAPRADRLGAVLAGVGEAEAASGAATHGPGSPSTASSVKACLAERRCGRQRLGRSSVLEREQRAHRVDRGARRVGLPVHVVEDLERQRPVVAGASTSPTKPARSNEPRPGKAGGGGSTPARPCSVAGRRPAAGGRSSPGDAAMPPGRHRGQHVERVQAQAERRMAGAPDDPPGVVLGDTSRPQARAS